jgi:hypothetical protein
MDINWFKENIRIQDKYQIEYSFFTNGDFGDLIRVEFENVNKGGNVDFWSSGWLDIHMVSYDTGLELLNVLLEPNQEKEKEKAFNELKQLL